MECLEDDLRSSVGDLTHAAVLDYYSFQEHESIFSICILVENEVMNEFFRLAHESEKAKAPSTV